MNYQPLLFPAIVLVFAVSLITSTSSDSVKWTPEQLTVIDSLRLENLPELPQSPGNPVADEESAARLGQFFFFDKNMSANGEVSCASCHQPSLNFTDGLAKSRGIGETARKSPTLVGAAYSPWLYWDGRRDSLWAQALSPLEDADEHGGTRTTYAHRIYNDAALRDHYEAVFSTLPDLSDSSRFPLSAGPKGTPAEKEAWLAMSSTDQKLVNHIFANIGRAIEAYERRLIPGTTAFDHYADALLNDDLKAADTFLSEDQQHGLQLFIGKAQCIHCHNGPLFTNNEFHNTGLFPENELPTDRGRIAGVLELLEDPFNCLGEESGADEQQCAELNFVKTQGVELVAAFRTPTLRNIKSVPPFMHTGEFDTMAAVLEHYNVARPTLISDELQPLNLDATELKQLELFLDSLNAPLNTEDNWLRPPQL